MLWIRREIAATWLVVAFALGCAETSDPPSTVPLGDGNAVLLSGVDETCPRGFETSFPSGTTKVCVDANFAVSELTRAECAANDLDCDALYGCSSRPITECDATATTADCGGAGPMTFGCTEGSAGECRWFIHGCVADGFRASLCPAEDVCCERTGYGTPAAFSDPSPGGSSTPYAGWAAGSFTSSFGPAPIALDDGFGLVVVETEPPSTSGVTVTCSTAPLLYPFFCDDHPVTSARTGASTWTLSESSVGVGRLYVDLRQVGDARLGRVCHVWLTDSIANSCGETDRFETQCTSTGTVELGAERVRVLTEFRGEPWVLEFPR